MNQNSIKLESQLRDEGVLLSPFEKGDVNGPKFIVHLKLKFIIRAKFKYTGSSGCPFVSPCETPHYQSVLVWSLGWKEAVLGARHLEECLPIMNKDST